jgi:hypothetical protein
MNALQSIRDRVRSLAAGLSDELWIWLLDRGWRVVTHRPDRRRYRDISWSRVTRLFDCDPVSREKLLAEAIWDAEFRPTVGNRSSS